MEYLPTFIIDLRQHVYIQIPGDSFYQLVGLPELVG